MFPFFTVAFLGWLLGLIPSLSIPVTPVVSKVHGALLPCRLCISRLPGRHRGLPSYHCPQSEEYLLNFPRRAASPGAAPSTRQVSVNRTP